MSVPASPARAPHARPDVCDAPLPCLVFQCRACRAVVGDSTGVDCSVRSLGVVALTAVCGVTVNDAPHAATLPPPADAATAGGGGEAAGCVALACAACGARLGRRFGADLPPRLARVGGLFCLDVDALASHELGSADLLARPKAGGGGGGAAAAAAPSSSAADVDALAARLAALEDELVRVQGVVLAHNERLDRLEQ